MKIKNLALTMALSAALFSCNDKKDSESTTVSTTDTATTETASMNTVSQQAYREGTAVVVTADSVPEPVRKSFTTKYPRLERVEWYSYTPIPEDEMEMDDRYYYVRFNEAGTDYMSWYNNRGEWVKTSTKVPGHKDLPDPVNQYINTNYSGYTIEEIHKENDKNMDMYEIKLNKDGNKVKIKILPDGQIFKRKSN